MADKFGKSMANKVTERGGADLLATDKRFQFPGLGMKRAILEGLGLTGDFGTQSFDCILTPEAMSELTLDTLPTSLPTLRLVEMKTTKKPIRSVALNQFFFGATAREFELARALGERYLFAFVVLSFINDYGRPFAVLLTLEQLEERIRAKRIQYQVNLRSDTPDDAASRELVVFDVLDDTLPKL